MSVSTSAAMVAWAVSEERWAERRRAWTWEGRRWEVTRSQPLRHCLSLHVVLRRSQLTDDLNRELTELEPKLA